MRVSIRRPETPSYGGIWTSPSLSHSWIPRLSSSQEPTSSVTHSKEGLAEKTMNWNIYSIHKYPAGAYVIKTSFDSLADSFTDPINIYIGQVSYVDYNNTFIPEGNTFSAYLHKRKSFEHEREIRAIIEGYPQFDNDTVYINSDLPDTWEIGRPCTVDLNTLVHEIIISPLTPNWIFDLVQSVVAKYGLSLPVSHSSIAETPHGG